MDWTRLARANSRCHRRRWSRRSVSWRTDQQGLQESLQKLMQEMEQMDVSPNGKLGQAGDAMGQAVENLGQADPGAAVGDQGDALDALREGAQGLAQQMVNNGRRGGGGRNGDQNFANQDPLGRPQRAVGADLGTTVKVPDEIDTQRAREILDAIRKRLGEIGRPPTRARLPRAPARPVLAGRSSTTPTNGSPRKAWATSMP